jgi:hypothetical protein
MFPIASAAFDQSSFFPALMFLFLPVLGLYLLNKSIMGDMGCLTALLMFGTSIYLLGIIWAVKDPWMHYVAVFGIVSLTVGIPILNVLTSKLSDKLAEAEQISACYQQIRMNPQNGMAAFRLARLLYDRGEKTTAIAIARGVMPHLPISAFQEEHRLFTYWAGREDLTASQEVDCVACGKLAPRGALICPHCLGSLHLERARKYSVVHNGQFRKIVTVYASLLIILLSIPLLGQFNPYISVPAILILLFAALWAVGAAFGLGFNKR